MFRHPASGTPRLLASDWLRALIFHKSSALE
jgi:hypothetical protein